MFHDLIRRKYDVVNAGRSFGMSPPAFKLDSFSSRQKSVDSLVSLSKQGGLQRDKERDLLDEAVRDNIVVLS